jgi:DNA-binding transcriptional regulator YdaS (Cro superfamily)
MGMSRHGDSIFRLIRHSVKVKAIYSGPRHVDSGDKPGFFSGPARVIQMLLQSLRARTLMPKRRKSGRTLEKPKPEAVAAMDRLRGERGMIAHIARELKILPQAIHQWRQIPLDRVVQIEEITGIPREELRPDFHLPRKGSRAAKSGTSINA